MTVELLTDFGLEHMTDPEIDTFVRAQRYGILGLATDGAPYLLPISYGVDAEQDLYLSFLSGPESRKGELAASDPEATMLVLRVDSPVRWQSVMLEGTLEAVPEAHHEDADAVLETAWRPSMLEEAVAAGRVTRYRLAVADRSGVKHTGLPTGLEP
ncbi:MAG: pyridoxamine 5'-phosphate oxidase family protein [Natrialbaceae archaeon]|nr:pyridoxamine 5'-phosphate oxidase family protein [Natrialbaceae archaeon]